MANTRKNCRKSRKNMMSRKSRKSSRRNNMMARKSRRNNMMARKSRRNNMMARKSRRNNMMARKSRRNNMMARKSRRNNMMGGRARSPSRGIVSRVYSPVSALGTGTGKTLTTAAKAAVNVFGTGVKGIDKTLKTAAGTINTTVSRIFSRRRKSQRRH